MFCKACGAEIPDNSTKCSQCGNNPYDESACEVKHVKPEFEFVHAKSRIIAGLLQIFLGCVGAGRFYLGYNTIAILQLIFTFITGGTGVIWPFIDGIMILLGNVRTDANGSPLS